MESNLRYLHEYITFQFNEYTTSLNNMVTKIKLPNDFSIRVWPVKSDVYIALFYQITEIPRIRAIVNRNDVTNTINKFINFAKKNSKLIINSLLLNTTSDFTCLQIYNRIHILLLFRGFPCKLKNDILQVAYSVPHSKVDAIVSITDTIATIVLNTDIIIPESMVVCSTYDEVEVCLLKYSNLMESDFLENYLLISRRMSRLIPIDNKNNTDIKSLCDTHCYSIYTQLFMKILDLKYHCWFVYGENISSIKIKLQDIVLKISVSIEEEKYTTAIVVENKKGMIDDSYKSCVTYEEIYNSILSLIKKIEK